MEQIDMPELVESLGSTDDSVRKRAAFRLQSIVGDPAFADTFEAAGGISKLRSLALTATGNTLAYSLASFSRLLELEQGWTTVDQKLIGRLVQLVVTHPLVNILRGAMSILALVVAHPTPKSATTDGELYGFRALKPAIDAFPNFLEMLVSRLSSADHALCANALQLVNALMRDSVVNDMDDEWPKFIKRLQDLGVIKAVYNLMQGSGIQDLAHPLLEFQCLTKILLRKWRETVVDSEKKEHRRALKIVHMASQPGGYSAASKDAKNKRNSKERDHEKWRNLGFETEMPATEFRQVGFLGVMDLTDYARKSEDGFHKLVLEQVEKPIAQRCPVAKASLAITAIMYDHFEIDAANSDDQQRYMALESRSNFDKVFKPLLLQWSRLHTAGLQAFLRLWASAGAQADDFYKIEELVRILIEHVVGLALRTEDVHNVEHELANYELQQLRELQMELLELTHEDAWGHHIRQIKEELHHEAIQFLKEQRIRCLLAGSWFPNLPPPKSSLRDSNATNATTGPFFPTPAFLRPSIDSRLSQATSPGHFRGGAAATAPVHLPPHRFVRLSHNRRYLHYADFDIKPDEPPTLTDLEHKIALSSVSSVISNVSPAEGADDHSAERFIFNDDAAKNRTSLTSTRSRGALTGQAKSTVTRSPAQPTHTIITIVGALPAAGTSPKSAKSGAIARQPSATVAPADAGASNASGAASTAAKDEHPLLMLHMASASLASEWLDGLLMLLNQAPITAETNRLVEFVAGYGLKIRLLNVRFDEALDTSNGGAGKAVNGLGIANGRFRGEVTLPSREGVDEEFFYDVAGV